MVGTKGGKWEERRGRSSYYEPKDIVSQKEMNTAATIGKKTYKLVVSGKVVSFLV